jgi:hypothetical protein
MLGFKLRSADYKWRYVGQKWSENEVVLEYCKGKFCPTMMQPKVRWRKRRLAKTLALLDFCRDKQTVEQIYQQHWGWWDVRSHPDAYY